MCKVQDKTSKDEDGCPLRALRPNAGNVACRQIMTSRNECQLCTYLMIMLTNIWEFAEHLHIWAWNTIPFLASLFISWLLFTLQNLVQMSTSLCSLIWKPPKQTSFFFSSSVLLSLFHFLSSLISHFPKNGEYFRTVLMLWALVLTLSTNGY